MMQNAHTAEIGHRRSRAIPFIPAERCRNCALNGARLCRAIWEKSSPELSQPVIRRFDRGSLVVGHDETSGFLGVIRRGYARRSTMRVSGKRVLLGLAVPGDIVGGLFEETYASDFEAASDVEICLYNRVSVKQQMQHDDRFKALLIQELDEQLRRLLRHLWRYGTLNSRERILAFLVWAAEVMPTEPLPDGSLVLSMEIDRRDWADLTNTTVETISRTLGYLDEKRLVTRLTPYRFRIRDVNRLAVLAGVEPPNLRVARRDRPVEAMNHRELLKPFEQRMTTVNA